MPKILPRTPAARARLASVIYDALLAYSPTARAENDHVPGFAEAWFAMLETTRERNERLGGNPDAWRGRETDPVETYY